MQLASPFSEAVNAAHAARARAAIAWRFQILLGRTAFSAADSLIYAAHIQGVMKRLESSFLANSRIPIGSGTRGSAIRQSSDRDLMLVLKRTEARWDGRLTSSTTVLNRVAGSLRLRFPNTAVGRDGQAVVVGFRDGRYPVDVVPALFDRIDNKIAIYLIPDGYGGWLEASPLVHNRFIARANLSSAGKLKNVAKLVKFWRWCRTPELPLSSFHVEILLATEAVCSGAKSYSSCLYEFFELMTSRECRALRDPCRVSNLIAAANTEAKCDRLYAAVQSSAEHALKALIAEQSGQAMDAVRQWNLVFNGSFPR